MEATKDIATKPAKPAKIKSNKKFTETEGFHAFVLFLPYGLLFFTFILLPIIIAIGLSFTYFDVINTPTFAGLNNYITLITGDEVFMKYVLPNTVLYAIVVGVGGYALSFLMAWILAQVTPRARTLYALAMYTTFNGRSVNDSGYLEGQFSQVTRQVWQTHIYRNWD